MILINQHCWGLLYSPRKMFKKFEILSSFDVSMYWLLVLVDITCTFWLGCRVTCQEAFFHLVKSFCLNIDLCYLIFAFLRGFLVLCDLCLTYQLRKCANVVNNREFVYNCDSRLYYTLFSTCAVFPLSFFSILCLSTMYRSDITF